MALVMANSLFVGPAVVGLLWGTMPRDIGAEVVAGSDKTTKGDSVAHWGLI